LGLGCGTANTANMIIIFVAETDVDTFVADTDTVDITVV
jgi:hypothetical protein